MDEMRLNAQAFEELLPELKSQEGKFAVIAEGKLIGTFNDQDDALAAAYKHCGLKPFFLKRISSTPDVANYTRALLFA